MSTFRMRPVHMKLLYGTYELRIGLYHLYKATPEQLCRLHYSPASLKFVKAALKELHRQGYVQVSSVAVRHETAKRQFYSARYFYTLAPAGVRYLTGLEFDVDPNWKPHNEPDRHGLFVDHTLELNDIIIAAAQLQERDPRFYLQTFQHEVVLKRNPYLVTLEAGREAKLMPDAELIFRRAGSSDHFVVMLEHDRGTEERAVFSRKIQSYVAFVKARKFVDAYNVRRVNICFTTFNGEARLEEMRRWTRSVLASTNEPAEVYAAFRFAALPKPLQPETAWLEPCWYYPGDDDRPQPLLAA